MKGGQADAGAREWEWGWGRQWIEHRLSIFVLLYVTLVESARLHPHSRIRAPGRTLTHESVLLAAPSLTNPCSWLHPHSRI
eukprot:353862-Chlamydomonas_euryale.AAC.2